MTRLRPLCVGLGVPMDYFGDTDILGVWMGLLCSPLGAMLLALSVFSILVNSLTRPRRRGPPRR